MRPGLASLEPIPKGALLALVSVGAFTLAGYFVLSSIPAASPEMLRTLALIGASFVLAYAVEAAWLVTNVELTEDHEEWLGFLTGVGVAGLLAIAFALLLAEHRALGHRNAIDDLGLGWIVGSLAILGGILVLQPLLADGLRDRGDD